MRITLTCCFLALCSFCYAQNLPSNAQVIKDVSAYHGKLQSAELNGTWQLVREAGYNFANTAKHPVAAITKKEVSGLQKKIQGLAIYVRGSASDSWRFSRYFMYDNSSEVIGAKALSNQELVGIVERALSTQSNLVFNNCGWICWIYSIKIPEPVVFKQMSGNEMMFEAEVEYEEKLSGMTERSKQIIEFNCRKNNGVWEMKYSMRRQLTPVSKRTNVPQSVLESLPGICDRPFAELYGPSGPSLGGGVKATTQAVGVKIKGLFKKN